MVHFPFPRAAVRVGLLAVLSLLALPRAGSGGAIPTLDMPPQRAARWQRPVQLRGDLHARLAESAPLVRAGEARSTYGLTGAGLTAAVLDTGIMASHQDFAGRVVASRNFTREYAGVPGNVADGDGHGTHVTGLLAAGGAVHTGIAPGARLAVVKVLDNNGDGSFGDIAAALQWVADHRAELSLSVVNLSLGDGLNYRTDNVRGPLNDGIAALRALDVPVCTAAGNGFGEYRSAQGMEYPAILRDSVSAGAVYDADLGRIAYSRELVARRTGPDLFTPFTQRLHESIDAACRTDLFAPGALLTSSGIESDSGSSTLQGTSQSAPLVAGAILLLQQEHLRQTGALPTVTQLETWLREGAVTIRDGDDEDDTVVNTGLDYPRLDVVGAIEAMRADLAGGTFAVRGRITRSGAPVAGVRVTAGSRTVFTTASGAYTLPALPAGSYTVQASHPGFTFTPAAAPVTLGPDREGLDFLATLAGVPPAAPARLIAGRIRRTSCQLEWRDQSSDEQGFRIESHLPGEPFVTAGSVGVNARAVRISGLSPRTTYYFRIRAFNANGASAPTNEVRIRTSG